MKTASRVLTLLPCLALTASASNFAITEVMYNALPGKPEFIEVINLTSNRIDAAKWVLSGGVDYTFPAFNAGASAAHFINEYERIVISSGTEAATRAAYPNIPPNVRIFGPWTGSLDNDGESFQIRDAAGALQTELSYGDGGSWPRAADGTGHSLQLINQDRKVDDWRNWRFSKSRNGTPGAEEPALAETPAASPQISTGSTFILTQFNDVAGTGNPSVPAAANPGDTQWRFYNAVAAPAADWMQPAGDLTGWSAAPGGFAPLGTENAAAPFIGIRTQVPQTAGLITYYFRATFDWTGPLTGNSFSIDQAIDDGVIYYLNGQEIGRDRMPNPEGHTNLADPTAVGDAALETNKVAGGPSILDGKLVASTNVIAASVHQNQGSSSDHVFAARLKITTASPAGVVINEIKPGLAGNGYVEFYNPTASDIDLQNYYLSDLAGTLTKFQITTPLNVPAMGFATIGFAESSLTIGAPTVVILTQPDGTTRQSHISTSMAADGRSLGRKPAGGSSWFLFTTPTPGADNASSSSGSSSPLRLNEVSFAAVTGRIQWVELFNNSSAPISGTGFFVSSQADLANKVVIGGSIPANGFASVNVDFPTDAGGDATLYLSDAADNIIAAVDVESRLGLPSMQAWPDGAGEWYAAATDTRDATNSPGRSTGVVINEVMYAPPSDHQNGEFVELISRAGSALNIGGWRFSRGIDYVFPPNTMIDPGECIVLAKDPAYITANYGGSVRVFGPVDGTLGNSGDLLRLEDAHQNLADLVDYKDGGNWPSLADGQGSSMELLHPDMDNSLPSSWRASDESAKSGFQTYTHTGTYRELRSSMAIGTVRSGANNNQNIPFTNEARELLLNLVSDGHIVMKQISLTKSTAPGTNMLANGDATSHGTGTGVNGFLCTGTHRQSDTLPDGFHLISTGGGDTKANKAEADLTGLLPNDIITLTFQARWVQGLPLLVAQTWDRSFGKVFRLPIPNNLGTPGTANSVVRAAAAPTVDSILHSPAVPTSTQNVTVTARVSSATALASVELLERVDTAAGNGAYNPIPMNDFGTGVDAVAGDGIYSAQVLARGDATITQFYVRATTVSGQVNVCPRDPETIPAVNGSVLSTYGRPAMWIVDNTPPTTVPGLLNERHVFSQYDRNAMNSGTGFSAAYDWDFPRMSNFGLNSTIIFNESDIYYGCEFRKGGSPWTRNGGNAMERARWRTPSDALFRDRSRNAIDSDGTVTNTAARFHNRISRYMMYLLGYPVPDSEFIQYVVNGDAPTWREEMEMTDSDFFDRAYGDGGELFEIDDGWFMFDTNNHDDRVDAGSVTGRWFLNDWTNTALGAKPSDESPIFFHGNWPVRFPEARYDYASLASFIRTASATYGITGTQVDDIITTSAPHGLTTSENLIFRGTGGTGLFPGSIYYAIVLSPTTLKFANSVGNANAGTALNFSTDITTGVIELPISDGNARGNAFREQMERAIDLDRAAIYTAVRGYIGDWDNFTINRGKNGYFFRRPADGKFEFHHWDSDLAFQNTAEVFIGSAGGLGWQNFSNRPWFRQRYAHYLTELINRYTRNSARMNAWLAAMNYQSANTDNNAPFKTAAYNYPATWFTPRETNAINSVNGYGGVNYTRAFAVTTVNNQTVATPLFSVAGAAPSAAARVEIVGHPEALLSWTGTNVNLGTWLLSGVRLSTGLNALTVRALGSDGAVLNSTVLNVTLSVNAPPVALLTAAPASRRVAANEQIVIDATTSYDPEATALSYAWSVTPGTGAIVAHSVPGKTEARFAIPGIYTVTVTVTDGASLTGTATTEVTVFNGNDFQPFPSASPLGPDWSIQNVELRDNFSPSSWYSVEDITGRLHIQLMDDAAYPLASPAFTHPLITRDLPDTADFVLQTEFEPDTREFGNWQSGLWITTTEDGTPVRYAFSIDNGLNAVVRRAVQPAAWTTAATQAVTGSGATLRIRRTPASLVFERQNGSAWTAVHTQALAAGSTAGTGGVFAASSAAINVRTSFDYVLLSDSSSFNPLLAALRITEVHYNPAPGGVEFIELRNTGNAPIDLTGVSFGEGQPFSTVGAPATPYTFGATMLAPGAYIVVTESNSLFTTLYGAAATLAPQWTAGNLSNGGERITLRDGEGNVIHDFVYDDLAPWPLAADGTGPSMEVINVNGDYNDGANWRASGEPTGSPGRTGLGPDTDGDGYPDSIEALFGTLPGDRNSTPAATTTRAANGEVTLAWPFTSGVTYDVECSTDLAAWTVIQTLTSLGAWTDPDAPANPRRLYRITPRLP